MMTSNLMRRPVALITRESDGGDRTAQLRETIRVAQEELDRQGDGTATYVVSLTHERIGLRRIGIDDSDGVSASAGLADVALQLVELASSKAARASIDPDSFDTSTEYEAALERRSRGFQVLEITRAGDTSRWRVTGSGPNGPFDLDIQAASAEDASFQARWDRSGRGSRPMSRDTAGNELAQLYEIEISGVEANPVTLRELYDGVVAAIGQGDDSNSWTPQIQEGEAWIRLQLQIAKLRDVFRSQDAEGAI